MKKSVKIGFVISALLFVFFIAFTILITQIDVDNIGPNKSAVGFAFINNIFLTLLGSNALYDTLSNILLILAFIPPIVFFITGIVQLIKRKKISKVDTELLLLAGIYILVIAGFVAFELIHINYRPMLVDNKLEPSYPSSHVLVSYSILSTTAPLLKKYISNKTLRKCLKFICIALLVSTVILRSLSGLHWITDIMGGLLLGATITSLYYAFIVLINDKRKS